MTSQLFVIEGIDISQFLTPPKDFFENNPTELKIYGTENERKEALGNLDD